jgi:hypothetical protein
VAPVILVALVTAVTLAVALSEVAKNKAAKSRAAKAAEPTMDVVAFEVELVVPPPKGAMPFWGCGAILGDAKV